MSISIEISRLQSDRNTIRAKLVELGMATSVDNLDKLATAIEAIVNQGAVSATVKEGETYTIPAGYHNGSGTVSGVAGGGSYNLQSKSATPTKKQQSITPDSGFYGLSDVTINPIPDAFQDVSSVTAEAAEVLTGKIFVKSDGSVITGTMANNGAAGKTLDVTTVSYTIPKGYHDGTGVAKIVLETKTVTPTKSPQTITPTSGKVLSEVHVEAIPDKFVDTSDANALPENILYEKTAYVGTTKVTGTMANNGAMNKEIDGITKTSVTIPAGYTTGGTVALTTDIEEALAAI